MNRVVKVNYLTGLRLVCYSLNFSRLFSLNHKFRPLLSSLLDETK